MDNLLNNFTDEIAGHSAWSFAEFYEKLTNKTIIEQWFHNYSKRKINVKDDSKAEDFRKLGNLFYIKGNTNEGLQYYNKSIIFATYKSTCYGLALANRSAVFFALKDYQSCIRDVKQSLISNYPDNLRPKLLIRITECYAKLCEEDLMKSFRFYAIDIIEQLNVPDKAKYIQTLNKIQVEKKKNVREKPKSIHLETLIENKDFLNASEAVGLSYNNTYGRHVVAKRDISAGEVLFQEKAFVFAPTFLDDEPPMKCYYCLAELDCFIPCKTCTVSLFCDKICRARSWSEFHQYECVGMQMNLWHDVGITYPALRAILKGGRDRFRQFIKVRDDYVYKLKFGNENDGYTYFNDLITNITYIKNITPIVVSAAVVVTYLLKHTNFLVDATHSHDLGCLLVKHSSQIAANSSIIQHWEFIDKNDFVPSKLNAVAAGIFLSISLMNHSCKANTTLQYIKDTVIVKSLCVIKKGKEIFNCYGIDYRHMSKMMRQNACKSLYYFTCDCEICSNPLLELAAFDSFLCQICKGLVPNSKMLNQLICRQCNNCVDLNRIRTVLTEAKESLKKWDPKGGAFSKMRSVLHKNHKDLEEWNNIYVTNFLQIGDLNKALKHFKDADIIRQNRLGSNSKTIAVERYHFLKDLMGCLQNKPLKDIASYSHIVEEMKVLLKETNFILLFYYHENFINLEEINTFITYMLEINKINNIFHRN